MRPLSILRLIQRDSTMNGLTYREQTRYDALGRAWKMRDASGYWVKQEYDARGSTWLLLVRRAKILSPSCG